MGYRHLDKLQSDWRRRRTEVLRRLGEFRQVGRGSDVDLFPELAFCLLAIQTSAFRSDAAVRHLADTDLLWWGSPEEIADALRRRVRFHNHKAAYLVAARDRFFGRGPTLRDLLRLPPPDARGWLVREVDGFGYKEASHFLRNVGRGEEFAILDRHILRNLEWHGVISGLPKSLTAKRYLAIEDQVRTFAKDVRIPMAAVDLLFWSRETGQVFK